jgi:hypothetical protein
MQKTVRYLLITLLTTAASVAAAAPVGYSINSDGIEDATHDSLYSIDLATGAETWIGRVTSRGVIRSDVEGLAFAPDGTLYGIDDDVMKLFPINPDNGTVQTSDDVFISGFLTHGNNDFGMTFACDGSLYITSVATKSLYHLALDGTTTLIGLEGNLGANISALAAYGENPVMLYGLGNGLDGDLKEDSPNLFRIDVETGIATELMELGGAAEAYAEGGLAFDDDGQLWAITDRRDPIGQPLPSELIQIDLDSATVSNVIQTNVAGFESLAITVPRGCEGTGGPNAQFKVQKQFLDGRDDLESTLNIRCNTGLPLEQTFTTLPGSGVEVTFTVTDFTDGQLDCEVWESATEGYHASYECFSTGTCTVTDSMCSYSGVEMGQEDLCVIRNYPESTQVTVASNWVDDSEASESIGAAAVDLICRNVLDGDGEWDRDEMHWSWVFQADTPDQVATMAPAYHDSTECRTVSTPISSAIEASSDCEDWTYIFRDTAPLTCTVTHTVFFEGIPALSRAGLLLTALLVLFTGLVFVRRF